jgi:hypothetical protein
MPMTGERLTTYLLVPNLLVWTWNVGYWGSLWLG